MKFRQRLTLVVVVVFFTLGRAYAMPNLNVELSAECRYRDQIDQCSFNPGGPYAFGGWDGSPASGSADFNPLYPGWSFSFYTANASTWSDDGMGTYSAEFGRGGSFDMTAPGGLTFSGIVISGESGSLLDYASVDVSFFGQWSNGMYASGRTDQNVQGLYSDVYLETKVTPEPASMVLFGTGILGLAGVIRRKINL